MTGGRRPRVLVINQYYDTVEASGQVLRQLCEDLAPTMDVVVVAARPPEVPGAYEGQPTPGLTVRWIRATHFPRTHPALRALNYVTFLIGAFMTALRVGAVDTVYSMTDPPVIGLVGLAVARLRRAPYVFTAQDIHPDLGVISGRLTSRSIVRVLRFVQRLVLRRADHIVAISEAMKDRLVERGAPAARVSVIPNWVDLDAIGPEQRDNEWAVENELIHKFTVMHSGNVGMLQSLDTLLDSAAKVPDVEFVVVGEGARKQELAQRAADAGLANVRFLPHQPRSMLRYSLASADAHLVSLVPGLAGYIEPSKAYGVLAAARPMLAAVDQTSDTGSIVQAADAGILVTPGDADALAQAVNRLKDMPRTEREEMGRRGRQAAETIYARNVITPKYRELLASVSCR